MRHRSSPENRCRNCGEIDCVKEMCDSTPPPTAYNIVKSTDVPEPISQPLDYVKE